MVCDVRYRCVPSKQPHNSLARTWTASDKVAREWFRNVADRPKWRTDRPSQAYTHAVAHFYFHTINTLYVIDSLKSMLYVNVQSALRQTFNNRPYGGVKKLWTTGGSLISLRWKFKCVSFSGRNYYRGGVENTKMEKTELKHSHLPKSWNKKSLHCSKCQK